MKIQVTQAHIDKGKRKSRCLCPIALALKDKFGYNCDPRVDTVHMALGTSTFYKSTPETVCFIDRFDGGAPVTPFDFELEPLMKSF